MKTIRACILVQFLVFIVLRAATETEFSKSICSTEGCKRAAQKILDNMDISVDPCDNFYNFACGGFIKNTIIPADKANIAPYTFINDILQERLKTILEEDYQPNEIKPFIALKRFYKSCINTSNIEKNGLRRINELLQQLGGWPVIEQEKWKENEFDWKNITWELKNLGMFSDAFINFDVDVHLKNSTVRTLVVDQAVLGLYQEVLSKGLNNSVVQAYYKLMKNIAVIFGADPKFAEKEMLDALNLEISIAKISQPNEKLRDLNLLFNPTTLNEMQIKYPSVDWINLANKLFRIKGKTISGAEGVNVQQPGFITDLIKLLKKYPKRVQANYAIWRAITSLTPYLNEPILQEVLEYEKKRTGIQDRKVRWKECVLIASVMHPTITGAMYVREHFSPEERNEVKEIVDSLLKVFNQMLNDLKWMNDKTKNHAREKLSNMITYVGYSDELLDDKLLEDYYSNLELNSDDFLQLALNTKLFRTQRNNERLRELIHRTDWRRRSTPAVINAFYSPTENSIEFPAGILQDVYFDKNRPRYINYGSIGFLIGHEITHGFDDQGRSFDEIGNLIDWWDKETNDAFIKKTRCIIDQYSNYTVPEIGIKINGVNTQGENIADNGAVKEAYMAYQEWVKLHGPEPILPGLNYTANQLFWISAANIWCSKANTEYMRLLVQTNVHCPNEYRVRGVLQNSEDFARDFKCALGSQMNQPKKCSVW